MGTKYDYQPKGPKQPMTDNAIPKTAEEIVYDNSYGDYRKSVTVQIHRQELIDAIEDYGLEKYAEGATKLHEAHEIMKKEAFEEGKKYAEDRSCTILAHSAKEIRREALVEAKNICESHWTIEGIAQKCSDEIQALIEKENKS